MGIYRPFIGGVKAPGALQERDCSNDKPFTPADAVTLTRPALALKAASMLLNGERGVLPVVAVMGITDAVDGNVARLIEKIWPNSGWGCTAHGAAWDTYADTAALLIVGAATLAAPRVTLGGKLAMATVFGQEGMKSGWALMRNNEYRQFSGDNLSFPPSVTGKEAMAEKLTAAAFAVATSDTDNAAMRAALTAGALCFAGVGAIRGESARRAYEPLVAEMTDDYLLGS